jgi:hypothetical protein
MHLVGYLYDAYHDARSLERKVVSGFCGSRFRILSLCAGC